MALFRATWDKLGREAVLLMTSRMGDMTRRSFDSEPGEGLAQEEVVQCPDDILHHTPDAVLGFRRKGARAVILMEFTVAAALRRKRA
mmetsp:Transcript_60782/g.143125  ORF Transcript_60782/g.143125 Transcript_60782/m.143125 type:complete len:87 (+) Transcript_60782:535-795(+)|eukprot:3131419-Rhodomonas_salina.2